MKKIKSIASVLLLLLWAALPCFSVSFFNYQNRSLNSHAASGKAAVNPEEQEAPIAWTEPTALHVTAVPPEHASLPLLLANSPQLPFIFYQAPCLVGSIHGFAYLVKRFRILPNGP